MKRLKEFKKKITKLKISDINKNSGSEISHSIIKSKIEEKKIMMAMVLLVLILVSIVVCFVFTAMSVEKIDGIQTGPLFVNFSNNDDGMGDVVDFRGNDKNSYSNKIKITNYKGLDSWYKIVLEDYQDMIDYDNCSGIKLSADEIYFSIDNSPPIVLASVYTGKGYLLTEGQIDSDIEVEHSLKMWTDSESDNHFHGKVVVSFVK